MKTNDFILDADNVSLLEENLNPIKSNTGIAWNASKRVGLEVNPDQIENIFFFKKSDQNHSVNITSKSLRILEILCNEELNKTYLMTKIQQMKFGK